MPMLAKKRGLAALAGLDSSTRNFSANLMGRLCLSCETNRFPDADDRETVFIARGRVLSPGPRSDFLANLHRTGSFESAR